MALSVLILYSLLVLAGGILGYAKARSRVSLFTGIGFALALGLCALGVVPHGLRVAMALQLILLGVFSLRFYKTRKFMPAGLLVIATLVALGLQWIG
jgi:uncharacterized membrane protein (UPF0136 family)